MTRDILRGEACKGCGRDLSRSFLTKITLGVEKGDALLYPVLCVCGTITVIGAGSFISHVDDLCREEADRTPSAKSRRPLAAREIGVD